MRRRIIIGTLLVVGLVLYLQRVAIEEFVTDLSKPPLPPTQTYSQVTSKPQAPVLPKPITPQPQPKPPAQPPTSTPVTDPVPVEPKSINLAVPFQPQAPFADWVEPYKEACEEASIIMVDHYYRNATLSAQQMKDAIDEQVAWQHKNFGGHFDLSVSQVATLAKAFYSYDTKIISPLTMETIREELSKGHPIIIPAAGRSLLNPYFQQPGPYYHMFVIKGLTKDGDFITNEPGTRRGADFVYPSVRLAEAVRDWDGDSPDGPIVGLVLYPKNN